MMPILNQTPYIEKQIVEPILASHPTNIVPRANYSSIKPQNGLTLLEHVVQGPHDVLGAVVHVLAHLSTHIIKNYLPIGIILPYGQPNPIPWVSIHQNLTCL
jgi:hypothetical protein